MLKFKTLHVPIAHAENLMECEILRIAATGPMPKLSLKRMYYDQITMELKVEFDIDRPTPEEMTKHFKGEGHGDQAQLQVPRDSEG